MTQIEYAIITMRGMVTIEVRRCTDEGAELIYEGNIYAGLAKLGQEGWTIPDSATLQQGAMFLATRALDLDDPQPQETPDAKPKRRGPRTQAEDDESEPDET
ncbi:MAG: hypothetical protein WC683_14070 [bacterium]